MTCSGFGASYLCGGLERRASGRRRVHGLRTVDGGGVLWLVLLNGGGRLRHSGAAQLFQVSIAMLRLCLRLSLRVRDLRRPSGLVDLVARAPGWLLACHLLPIGRRGLVFGASERGRRRGCGLPAARIG